MADEMYKHEKKSSAIIQIPSPDPNWCVAEPSHTNIQTYLQPAENNQDQMFSFELLAFILAEYLAALKEPQVIFKGTLSFFHPTSG